MVCKNEGICRFLGSPWVLITMATRKIEPSQATACKRWSLHSVRVRVRLRVRVGWYLLA